MRAPIMSLLASEPYQSGTITGFAALGSAAVINLASYYLLGSASAPGTSGFLLAVAVSAVAGSIAGARAKRRADISHQDLELAAKFTAGDYSSCIRSAEQSDSAMAGAMMAIAERQLQIATANARLINDASLRQDQLFSALDCVADEIAVYDRSGLLVATNKAFSRRCNQIGALVEPGMLQAEVLNALAKSQGARLPMNERDTWFKLQADIRAESMQSGKPVRFMRFHGEPATILVEKTSDGNTVELIRDIGRDMELEERALRAEREAVAADRIKSVTLSRLSHTIRTPMTGVLTAAELMLNSDMDALQRDRLDIIRRSAGTLLGVVQDMFDLANETTEVDGAQLPAGANDAALARQPDRVILYVPANRDVAGVCDQLADDGFDVAVAESAVLAVQTVAHLALSSRPVSLILVPSAQDAADILAELDKSSSRPHPPVQVYSPHTAVLDRPVEASLSVVEIAGLALATPANDVEILIVEDDDVNQIVFTQALTVSGYSYAVVGNGADAVALAKSGKPRLVLMDVSMPGMNGIEATRLIRSQSRDAQVPPVIIGMTNHFLPGDKGKCLAAGMDDYTLKPDNASALTTQIEQWLSLKPMKKAG
ncbi:MAG: response regulator [Rhizobiaceae bacterium]